MREFPSKSDGNTYSATEFNGWVEEGENAVKSTNQTLFSGGQDDADTNTNQISIAMSVYAAGGEFYTDSGTANSYVLSPVSVGGNARKAPHAYQNGMRIRFIVGNSNTGASTVNVDTLGSKDIKKLEGGSFVNVEASDLSQNSTVILEYNVTEDAFILIYSNQQFEKSGTTNLIIISTSQTYTPSDGVKSVKIIAVGAGGGAGGVDGQGAGTAAASVAGGGGGTAISFITKASLESSYTVTIGSGGAGGAGSGNGSDGGTTSVVGSVLNMVANGGKGGSGRTASSGLSLASGASGGTASGGNEQNIPGGGTGLGGSNGAGGPVGGHPGGTSWYGPGGKAVNGGNGESSGNPGAGGGSAVVAVTTDNFSGGSGGNGRVIVEEYF